MHEILKQDAPIVCYSPFSVKFLKLKPDIIFEPGKPKNGTIIENFNLIVFFKDFNNFWVPNAKQFGDEDIFGGYEVLTIIQNSVEVANERICDILNNIRSKSFYIFFLKYSYQDIKKM